MPLNSTDKSTDRANAILVKRHRLLKEMGMSVAEISLIFEQVFIRYAIWATFPH